MIAGGADWRFIRFAMFTAYFDASGDVHKAPMVVMAGFIASAEAWIIWEKEWLARLKKDGLTYLHMKELYRWDPIKKNRLIHDLCELIRSHVSNKFGAIVINRQLAKLSELDRKRWYVHSYSYAGRTCAKEARIWASQWSGPLPELIFEKGDTGQKELRKLLESRGGYPTFQFRPKKDCRDRKSGMLVKAAIPLQAADLLAYEVAAWVHRVQEEKPKRQRDCPRIQGDLDKVPGFIGVLTDDYLRFFKEGMDQIDSLVMTTNVKIRTK